MHLLPLLAVTLSSLAALGTSSALPFPAPVPEPAPANLEPRLTVLEQRTDTILYTFNMATFQRAKRNRDPAQLNWNDNGCTIVPDKPLGFNFLPACQRHDFGYINYRNQRRCSESNRLRVDNQFLEDMLNQCEAQLPGILNIIARGACNLAAGQYYGSVRILAAPFFCGPLSKRMSGEE